MDFSFEKVALFQVVTKASSTQHVKEDLPINLVDEFFIEEDT